MNDDQPDFDLGPMTVKEALAMLDDPKKPMLQLWAFRALRRWGAKQQITDPNDSRLVAEFVFADYPDDEAGVDAWMHIMHLPKEGTS